VAFITMVKKQSRNGIPSEKSHEVENHLTAEGLIDLVNRVVIAQEGDLSSEGMRLAEIYQVDCTPFFLVADETGGVKLYTRYTQLLKDVLLPANQQRQSINSLTRKNAA